MSKTADLRKLITAQLNTVPGATYYRNAAADATYPYKTFELSRANLGDLARDDIDLCVDVWDHGADTKAVDLIADSIEDLFNAVNLPQETILPTFFRDSRYPVKEEDKTIQHIQLHFLVQNYTLKEEPHGSN